jgi:hypothetical protein
VCRTSRLTVMGVTGKSTVVYWRASICCLFGLRQLVKELWSSGSKEVGV